MKTIADEQYWAEMIAKYLSGNCEAAETRELMQWVDEAEENKEYMEGMQSVWNLTQSIEGHRPDVDAWWERTAGQMGQNGGARVVRMPSVYRMVAAAAAVVVLVVSGFLLIRNMGGGASHPVLVSAHADSLRQMVVLPDNSTVWLRGNSTLEYDEAFKERKVSLTGEAYFEVESDPDHPFAVYAGGAVAHVLGTKFNVRETNSGDVELIVEEGKVAFGDQSMKLEEHVVFSANEGAVFNEELAVVEQLEEVRENAASWKSGELVFRDTPLDKVLTDLGRHYGYNYSLQDSALYSYDLNAEFSDQDHEEVIEAIEFMLNIDFRRDGDTLRITRQPKTGDEE